MPTKDLRSIDNIDTNDMNFKHLETTKDIVISPKNEYGDPQRPDPSHKWTAKVSDGTNYVGDYLVEIMGDAIRKQYGTNDKYSLGDMPKMIDSLQVTNILDDNQFYDTSKDKENKTITGLDQAKINSLAGKTIVISFDVEWDGFEYTDGYNRSGMDGSLDIT